MNSFYALVVVVQLMSGQTQEQVLGVYESEDACFQAAAEQEVKDGQCWPVDGIIHTDEVPAAQLARKGEE